MATSAVDGATSSAAVEGGAVESEKKMIVVRSSDGEEFELEEAVAMVSQTIRHMIEDDCADNVIPLANVHSKILAMVIQYFKKHVPAANSSDANKDDLKTWDAEFVKLDKNTLFELILAANYLNINGLLDLTCQAVADKIKTMKVEEIREFFNIVNDFTPEEEEEIRKENQWAFD